MSTQNVEYRISLRDQLSLGLKRATKNTNRLDKAVNRTRRSFSGLGSALGVGLGLAGAASFGSAIVDSLKNYEYFSVALRTLMKGDAQAALALETQLIQLAAVTPFSLVEVQDATKQLIAYGFSAGDVTKNINMLGDVAAALKIPFGDIAYLYGTLKTQGRAYTRDILQFTNRGIPIIGLLADQFGVAKEEIKGMVEEGKVGFPEIEKAFKTMTGEGGMFFNMMDEQSKTVGGRLSNMADSWEQLKVNIGKSQRGIMSGTITFMSGMISTMTESFARANKLESSFDTFGAKQLGAFELRTTKDRLRGQSAFWDNLAKGSDESLKVALQKETEIQNSLSLLRKRFRDKEISAVEFSRQRAMRKSALATVAGNISLFGKTEGEATAGAGGAPGALKGGTNSTTVEARGSQNFNIDIDNLVENLVIKAESVKESAGEVEEIIVKTLIRAVNDFQLLASK